MNKHTILIKGQEVTINLPAGPTVRLILLAAVLVLSLVLNLTSGPEIAATATCTTDTECMERLGGDGGPGR